MLIKRIPPLALALTLAVSATSASAAAHAMLGVSAKDQPVVDGTIAADSVVAAEWGWLVVHRTDASMKPGPVVGSAPLMAGENTNVAAILTEPLKSGDMVMLMLHTDNGMTAGSFEYTLGAKVDGPHRVDGKLVMDVITIK